jgi:hypothetical protein
MCQLKDSCTPPSAVHHAKRGFPDPSSPLSPGRTAVAVSAGYKTTCAVLSDGNAACWGQGSNGQLGTGAATNRGDQVGELGNNLITINLGLGCVPPEDDRIGHLGSCRIESVNF